MRRPIGSSILLVLIVSFLCISPISSYLNDSEVPEDQEQPNNGSQVANLVIGAATQSADEPLIEDANQQQAKRGMGMPGPHMSAREMGGTPEQVVGLSHQMMNPINDPNQMLHNSQARGLGSEILTAITNSAQGNPDQGSQPQTQSQNQAAPGQAVRMEDLPTIIENNKPVGLKQQAESMSPPLQGNAQAQGPQQSPQMQPQQSFQAPPTGLGTQQLPTNMTIPMSSARTFDSWTNCVGSSTNKYGTCKNDVECNKNKGRADGSCMGGFGVCCVMALTCGDKSLENNTFYANPDFPEPSWEARLCEVEVKKKHKNILQVMIEFEEFELAPPNHDGECITDVFQVKLASNRPSPYSLLRICGQNTGQHLYLDVSQIEEPLVLSVATSGGGFPRRWSIRIVQMDDKNFLLAPPGCLQYYTDTVGHFRSFNLGRNLKNLYYAVCFRIDNGYSGIRFTDNFFGMNGPSCRKKVAGPNHGRQNISYEAHPHHLVIPPPGYGQPPPKPKFYRPPPHHALMGHPPMHNHGFKFSGRIRRQAGYSEIVERTTRTHHEKDFDHEKEFKHEHMHSPPAMHGGYGGSAPQGPGSYGSYQQGPPPGYAGGQYYGSYQYQQPYESKKEEYKDDKVISKGDVKADSWSWKDKMSDPFGWHSKDASGEAKFDKNEKYDGKYEGKYESKYDNKYENKYALSPQGYGPPGYGPPGYGPPGYGPPSYGPPGYGQQGGYGPPQAYGGYGEYHHKEIDKFGKKFEHLEYKHEKNHLGKEDKTSSSWWPIWGKKEEKKDKKDKDKFYQHHEALFPVMRIPEMPHCEPRFCGQNDVITFPPSGDSISEMCGNRFNRGRGPKIISGSPLVVYVSNRGLHRGSGFDMNYEQVFYIPRPY